MVPQRVAAVDGSTAAAGRANCSSFSIRVAASARRSRDRGPASGSIRDEPSLGFVARLDPKESDLRRVDEAELKAQLGGAGSAQVASSAQAAEGARGTPLWGGLLLVGVLALLGEGALTRR